MGRKGGKLEVHVNPNPVERSDEQRIEETAQLCQQSFRQAVNAIMACGEHLAALKAALPEGKGWRAAFGEDRDGPVSENPFPFSRSTADQLIQIFQRFNVASIASHIDQKRLPPSWTTLYELSRLDDETLQQHADEIHPGITRREVTAMRPKSASQKNPAAQKVSESNLDKAHDIYLRLPPDRLLQEIANLLSDSGYSIEDLRRITEESDDE